MADEQSKPVEEIKVEEKVEQPKKEQKQPEKAKPVVEPALTYVILHSKANFNIPITYNGQILTIPPFGRVKVIKERMKFDPQFGKYLTLIKA